LELVNLNKGSEPKPEPQPLDKEPTKEWLESKAGYLELTKKQNSQGWRFNFPYIVASPLGQVQIEERFRQIFIIQPLRWRITYQRYEGSVERSYKNWPAYAYIQLPPAYRKNSTELKHFKVTNESGWAEYYRVWADDPYAENSVYAGRYTIPVFALWTSSGTVEPKATRRKV
jgi:hypothetical protein